MDSGRLSSSSSFHSAAGGCEDGATSPAKEASSTRRFFVAIVIFDYFFLGLFFVHALPWILFYYVLSRLWVYCCCQGWPMEGADYLEDGRVNATRWMWSLYLNYGSTMSALFLANYAGAFTKKSSARFGIAVGYVSWFGTIALLATVNFLVEVGAGKMARDKFSECSWLGTMLLRAFNVPARVVGSQAFVDVLIAASLLPAIVAGFLAFWFANPSYGLRCSPKIDNSELCNSVSGKEICCRVVNTKYDVGDFIPFLISYIVAGYALAIVLVNLLVARHSSANDIELLYARQSQTGQNCIGTSIRGRLSTRTAFPLPRDGDSFFPKTPKPAAAASDSPGHDAADSRL